METRAKERRDGKKVGVLLGRARLVVRMEDARWMDAVSAGLTCLVGQSSRSVRLEGGGGTTRCFCHE